MTIFSKVQLMVYPDCFGGNLQNLKITLDTHLKNSISLVHILPPYPSSGDRGFAPLTHLDIEPKWGNWSDIESISNDYNLMLDLIVGHVSVESVFFQDYLKKGESSEFYDMFMRVEKTFDDKNIKIEELVNFAYLTPIPPLIVFKLRDGKCKLHFKTFLPTQADLDLNSPITKDILIQFIQNHAKMGVKFIRLDAVETVCKNRKFGYHLVPETFEIIQWLIDTIKDNKMEALCEVFGEKRLKDRIVNMGAWIYDFNLPDIILHAILSQKSHHLKTWLAREVKNTITVLTNHDGFMIGRILESLTYEEAKFTRKMVLENSGEITQKASGLLANNVASDGINATLFEVFFRDQEKWLLAQALHLFAPGVPQIYYNDMLAQTNDLEMFEETGEGRSLIRHNFGMSELDHVFKNPYVEKLIKIMEFRNNFPAFEGKQIVEDSSDSAFVITWKKDNYQTTLSVDLSCFKFEIKYISGNQKEKDLEL